MSISMIAIRIVLLDTSKKLSKSINYTALKYSHNLANTAEVPPQEVDLIEAVGGSILSDNKLPDTDLRVTRDITIEHYNMEKEVTAADSTGGDSSASATATSASGSESTAIQNTSQTPFYIGNHYVEIIQGILHLYKENKKTPLGEEAERSDIICMLSVSANKTIHDILQFTAPFNQDIQHIQIIRDSKPNQYMVLLKFHTQRSADEFYNSLNGTAYNSIEPELCHLAFVAQVEVMDEATVKGAHLPITGFTELPTCPVCLERMDESVQGILTILCNHSFHSKCLDQWYDCSCPVCRYCQTPELLPENRCFECGSQSTTQDTLWICLICGHIGCGRYVQGHAHKHYKESQHTYAMQLGLNNRVWDYAGDNYVHRLLQSSKDGEPVELKAAADSTHNHNNSSVISDEKVDAVQLEYTYLLTNQLETQRRYYEETMSLSEKEKQAEIDSLIEKNRHLEAENRRLVEGLETAKKERQSLEKKVAAVSAKLTKTTAGFGEEMELNKSLRQNQDEWAKKLAEIEASNERKELQINELQEQLRDVMFFLEAKDKLQTVTEVSKEELQEGQIYIQPNSSRSSGGSSAGGGNSSSKSKSKHGKGK